MDGIGLEADGAEADAAAASSMHLVPATGGSLQSGSARSRQRSRCSSPLFGTMAHGGSQLRSLNGHNRASLGSFTLKQSAGCRMCGDELAAEDDQDDFSPCDCTFQMCTVCLEHLTIFDDRSGRAMKSFLCTEDTPTAVPNGMDVAPSLPDIGATDHAYQLVKGTQDPPGVEVIACENSSELPVASTAHYGFGSIAWHHPPCKANARGNPSADIKLRGLFRKSSYPASKIGPYRIFVFLRFCATVSFIQYRVTHPTASGYWLWFLSVTCEIWFFISWLLDTFSKLTPVCRETYKDRLSAIYDNGQKDLPKVDVFVTTADAQKESPFVTACTVLSIVSADYPANKLACYLSDDGSSMLTFNVMAEVAGFARIWVPFCKRFDIEPRNPEAYFAHKFDFLKDKIQSDFVRSRRKVKKEFEEFKVRVNRLVADSSHPPAEGWQMKDGSPWPGNNYLNHDGIIQVFLHPDGDVMDVEGEHLPPLIYVSREKRPGHNHNKKAGAINALLRASGLITNGPYLINLDCDHYISNSQAIREALCFFLDPIKGRNIGFVQFPQRFDGVDQNDRYANHNTVFFDINMKGLDGLQGPVYVGTGCMFRRRVCSLFSRSFLTCSAISCSFNCLLQKELPPVKLGMCSNFIESAMREENGQKSPFGLLSPYSILSDVVLSISCDYEDKTDWGTEVGWIYGSLTEDIVTGLRIHSCGLRLQGSAPLNMADRLHQVERYFNNAFYPFTSLAIVVYCLLPPLALLTDLFFIPVLDHYGVVCFTTLICSFLILSLLELRWSNVSFEAWWRNEQFWVIAGLTSHLAALVQGLLKVFAGIEIAFTVTSKGANSLDNHVDELHTFQFSWLLLPAVIVGLLNILGVIIGFARAFNTTSAVRDWGQLLGKLAFSLWVLVHLYPFGKGLLGRREKVPTIIFVWAVLLTITTTLLWASFAPQRSTPTVY
eukprot:SM000047S16834  [mRNA]  locus=s47:235725:242330:+ [translate_table: standard]